MRRLLGGLLVTCMVATAAPSSAGVLMVATNRAEPAAQAAFRQLIDSFSQAHPEVEVELKTFDHEGYKTAIQTMLAAQAPDVISWFAGRRMRELIERGLLEDVSEMWQSNGLHESMAPSLSALTVDGRQWGVPYAHYHWGVYYRRDLFAEFGLGVPLSWDELLNAGAVLNENGITPIAIGTQYPWAAAGWFDYLNLRVNGLPFHLDLMAGRVAYTDSRVVNVFDHWRRLVEGNFYIGNHASYSFLDAAAFLFEGSAAMYLAGNFVMPQFPAEVIDRISFFPFPAMDAAMPNYEVAPTETLHIPVKAQNKTDARKFLAFVAQPQVQTALNQVLGDVPPNTRGSVSDDRFLLAGFKLLSEAHGLAQSYDRDTDPEMAKIGMQGFQEFMQNPDRLEKILTRLEKARKRIFQ